MYIKKYVIALILRSRPPQTKIIKNIGINKLSKNKQNKNKSKTVNANTKKNSILKINTNNHLTSLFSQTDKTQNGKINKVNNRKKIEIPSTPNTT